MLLSSLPCSRFWRAAQAIAVLPLLCGLLSSARGAHAQTEKQEAPPVSKPPVLGDALARVPWSSEQGVLLTLSPLLPLPAPPKKYATDGGLPPENARDNETDPLTNAEAQQIARLMQTAPDQAAPLRLALVARAWKRRVLTFGTVTTAAPSVMTVLNPKPGPPDLLAGVSESELTQYLFATFTPAQWRLLASQNGIGRGDLQNKQTVLFDRIVPAPFTYTYATTHYQGRVNDPARTHTLSDSERQAVRLHVKLQTDVGAPLLAAGREGSFFPVVFNGNRDGGIFGDLKSPPFLDIVHSERADSIAAADSGDTVKFGVSLAQEVRNKPKPSDLDFAALTGLVSLLPPPAKPAPAGAQPAPSAPILTVGDLMPRLRQATGLDLYADARLLNRRVWTRGADSAKAGDLLQALCFCVAGAVRKVEAPGEKPAYILTSDKEGIAARASVLDDWESDAQARKAQIKADYLQAVRKINPLPFLEADRDDPIKLPRALIDRVATGQAGTSGPKGYLVVNPSELTPAQQAYLNTQVAGSSAHKGFEVGSDRYELGVTLWLGLVIPGVGEITGSPLQSVNEIVPDSTKPAAPLPITGAGLWAKIPITNDDAAKAAAREIVDTAASRKLRAVYLEGARPSALQAAAEQAATAQNGSGPAVWGVLRPLQARPDQAEPVDLNSRSQTTAEYAAGRAGKATPVAVFPSTLNWQRVSDPHTAQAAQTEAAAMAKVPGLAGILVADALPPGYRGGTENGVNPGDGNTDFRAGAGIELGFTPEQRLQFLRQNSADPWDIVPYFSYAPAQIPYFPDSGHTDGGLADAWSKWRAARGQAFLTQLRQSIESVHPGLPVQICGQVNESPLAHTTAVEWLVDWLPGANSGNVRLFWNYPKPGVPFAQVARQNDAHAPAKGADTVAAAPTRRAFLRVSFPDADATLLRGGTGWDGVVFDFSRVPPDLLQEKVRALSNAPVAP